MRHFSGWNPVNRQTVQDDATAIVVRLTVGSPRADAELVES
jgi:hypothetical protein